ncbi:MAG: response regulator [Chloroflexi bacterium]|nr:response regulator [Chloroflexota bacterium]
MTIRRGKALIMDDDPATRELLLSILDEALFYCYAAADGAQALELALKERFDLVLLDIHLPEMSGMEVLQRMRVMQPDACFVMVTAVEEVSTAVEAMKLGAYDYVVKPFEPRELVPKVEQALLRRDEAVRKRQREKELEAKVEAQRQEMRGYISETVQALAQEHVLEQELSGIPKGKRSKITAKDILARLRRHQKESPGPPQQS